jgi:hypothetical protein
MSVIRTLIEAIKQAANAIDKSGPEQARITEPDNPHTPLSAEECDRFVQSLSEVSPSLKPMLVQHFYAFAQLRARRPVHHIVFSAEQIQLVSGSTSPQQRSAKQMDPLALASAAVAALSPYLAKAGEGAAKKIGEEAVDTGGKLLAWMRAKLGGRATAALDELAAEPNSELNQTDLRTQVAKALQADPALAAELNALLPDSATSADIMTQDVSGAGAKAAQVKGSGNTTTIS